MQFVKETIHGVLGKLGLEIRRLPPGTFRASSRRHSQELPLFLHALQRLRRARLDIQTVIDVGASDARWSEDFARIIPGKNHLLLDASRQHEPVLRTACQRHPGWSFEITAVGEKPGELYFDSSDPMGGHLSDRPLTANYFPCPVTNIDTLIARSGFRGPFLLKLDTHGVEIPILLGARQTLLTTSVVFVECYNFSLGRPAVPFWEFCAFMWDLGFRPIDLCDVLYRERDRALWQLDLVFVRATLPLFQDLSFFVTPP